MVLPSYTIILAVALFFAGIRDNAAVDAAFKGMRPAVVALIIVGAAMRMLSLIQNEVVIPSGWGARHG